MINTVTASGDTLIIEGDPEFADWVEQLVKTPEFAQQCEELDAFKKANGFA